MPKFHGEAGGEESFRKEKHFEQRLQEYANMNSRDIPDGERKSVERRWEK